MLNVIYAPKGKAGEYAELACSVYLNCTHRCEYCYCPQVLHVSRESFFSVPKPRPNFLEKLTKDAQIVKEAALGKPILLSFIGDPYQPINDEYTLTRKAILIL